MTGVCVPSALKMQGFPTILVARNQDGLDDPLVDCLRRDGFHVLEADDFDHVVDVVKVHSRPIHLLLAAVYMEAHVPFLKRHRPELIFLLVTKRFDPDEVLAKVKQLLGSPQSPSQFAGEVAHCGIEDVDNAPNDDFA